MSGLKACWGGRGGKNSLIICTNTHLLAPGPTVQLLAVRLMARLLAARQAVQ